MNAIGLHLTLNCAQRPARKILARGDSSGSVCWSWHSLGFSGNRTRYVAFPSILLVLTANRRVALAKKYSTYSISWKLRLSFTSTFSEEVTPQKASGAFAHRARHLPYLCCLPSVILRPPDTVGSSKLYNSVRPTLRRIGLTGTDFFATATCAETGTRCQLHRSRTSWPARPSDVGIGRSA